MRTDAADRRRDVAVEVIVPEPVQRDQNESRVHLATRSAHDQNHNNHDDDEEEDYAQRNRVALALTIPWRLLKNEIETR